MGYFKVFGRVLLAAVAIATVARIAAWARPALVTMYFWGDVDLTPFGGPPSSSFQGSVTWNPFTKPFGPWDINFAYYQVQNLTLSINGTDYASRINPPSPFIEVNEFGEFGVVMDFSPYLDFGAAPADVFRFVGWLSGPDSAFPKHALPKNLGFLPAMTGPNRSVFESKDYSIKAMGTFVAAGPAVLLQNDPGLISP